MWLGRKEEESGTKRYVRKPSGNYKKEDRAGNERKKLGYLESDSGWRTKVKFCVCDYIVHLQQYRIGITLTHTHRHTHIHIFIYTHIYKYIYIYTYKIVQ